MRELWSTIEADEVLAEDLEVHNYFIALLIAWCICRRDPVIGDFTAGEDAGVEVGCFASTAVEPEACSEFHQRRVIQELQVYARLDEFFYESLRERLINRKMNCTHSL